MPFHVVPAKQIPEVLIFTPTIHKDHRGFFSETYKLSEYTDLGLPICFVQDNHSHSIGKGMIRGLHLQKPPKALGKLVYVIAGKIFDVAVDVRKGSPTYGQWVAEILSEENKKLMYTPEGFAHGFMTLSDQTDVIYKMTGEYAQDHEIAIRWDDPDIQISWPLADPILSERDKLNPYLKEIDTGFIFIHSQKGKEALDGKS